ncbi:putative UDP-galactose 4-epimerase [Polyplosphaeria fusca]|uniref:UDP-galactose 4-epimerase n=1 Tax=Polyplosphaeria fusca TaxID=682080 RepID=A0A9P4QHN1_9PLEO|nr:putative UDP-galactose 4-epimerase [Polyplosphaeria fusca]
MKIAVTGAQGCLGKDVVRLCAAAGHSTVQIDRIDAAPNDIPNSEIRTVDATDYDAMVAALQGCDALIHLASVPRPGILPEPATFANNVQSSFVGFRACGEAGIKRICYASSINAIGLVFSHVKPIKYAYFPIDEDYPANPTDGYSLAKLGSEAQARAFANWFPGTKIACLRLHWIIERERVMEFQKSEDCAVENLWGYVEPAAAARACLLAVEQADRFEGSQVFNIANPRTTSEESSAELAKRYFPDVEVREGLEENRGFWAVGKAEEVLGWRHDEGMVGTP